MIRQPIIAVMGHVDHGKCVSGDTILELGDGRLMSAESAFEIFKTGLSIPQPNGEAYPVKNLKLLSLNENGIAVSKEVSYIFRFAAEKLVHINTKAGYEIKTTPEHKFLVLNEKGKLEYLESGRLKLGDSLVIPSNILVSSISLSEIKQQIFLSLDDSFLIKISKELNNIIADYCRNNGIYKIGKEIGDISLWYHIRDGYYRPSVLKKIFSLLSNFDQSGIYDHIEKIKFSSTKKRASHRSFWLKIPHKQEEFEALYYILGLLYGDGICKDANLSNTSEFIMNEFRLCIMKAFGIGSTTTWRRTPYIVYHRGGSTFEKFLSHIFDYPESDKTRTLKAPDIICASSNELVGKFLKGFFDAEGFVQAENNNGNVGIGCESNILMRQIPILLHRFKCFAYFVKRKKRSGLELCISGSKNLKAFYENIGFREPRKTEQLKINIEKSVSSRIFESTPIKGDIVKEFREKYSIKGTDKFQLSYYESKQRLTGHAISQLMCLAPEHEESELISILSSYRIIRVSELKILEGEFSVYDFTIENTHNFMANGFIVHNTTLLDKIRNTAVAAKEAGGITQHIGASEVPMEIIDDICGPLLRSSNIKVTIPGLLFIDTPGHEAFTNLRIRGGSIADIAILIVDISKGFEPQTVEALEILREYKTPFVVAANKIDLITGWRATGSKSINEALKQQSSHIPEEIDAKVYELVGKLSEYGLNSELYSRVRDFQKELAIIPISAKTGEGLAELLMVVTGLAQRYLEAKLKIEITGPGKGSILEKNEIKGLGITIDVILYDGTLRVNDSIAFAVPEGVGTAKIKALLKPKAFHKGSDSAGNYTYVEFVGAASGIKISGNGLEDAIPGWPIVQVTDSNYASEIKSEMGDVFKTDKTGVILKADTIGSIDAISKLLKNLNFNISKKGIGKVTKRDIMDAFNMNANDPLGVAILAFDVGIENDAQEASETSNVKIIKSEVIYKLIDDYKLFVEQQQRSSSQKVESKIVFPGAVEVLRDSFFRVSHPAIFGINVIAGRIKPGYRMMSDSGAMIGKIKGIQNEKEPAEIAKKGDRMAISIEGPTLGRQIREGQILYTYISEEDYKLLTKDFAHLINDEERELLKKIHGIKLEK